MIDDASAMTSGREAISGRYVIFAGGRECGEERWRIEPSADGFVANGEQVLWPPHPFPSHLEYRAVLSAAWRPTSLELLWTVGDNTLRAVHGAAGGTWRARIEYQGEVREQHGDYPDVCEVECLTQLSNAFILARRDFGLDGEHEFPVLRIGPPLMAVTPERMLMRCVEVGEHATPHGAVKAKRYVVSLPPRTAEEGYTFWADEEGFVLESFDGLDTSSPWMKLVEFERHRLS